MKERIKKIISYILLLACLVNLGSAVISPNYAKADSLLGTNLALGSPLLNPNAVSDDWNKYESLVWGIFLSNFCVPFVDDYESAFSLSSTNGSKGRGLKALQFGSGSDPTNSKVIQELLNYAINMQKSSVRPIYVSYNTMESGVFNTINAFGSMKSK